MKTRENSNEVAGARENVTTVDFDAAVKTRKICQFKWKKYLRKVCVSVKNINLTFCVNRAMTFAPNRKARRPKS